MILREDVWSRLVDFVAAHLPPCRVKPENLFSEANEDQEEQRLPRAGLSKQQARSRIHPDAPRVCNSRASGYLRSNTFFDSVTPPRSRRMK